MCTVWFRSFSRMALRYGSSGLVCKFGQETRELGRLPRFPNLTIIAEDSLNLRAIREIDRSNATKVFFPASVVTTHAVSEAQISGVSRAARSGLAGWRNLAHRNFSTVGFRDQLHFRPSSKERGNAKSHHGCHVHCLHPDL